MGRKILIGLYIVLLFLSCAKKENRRIIKIEHFYISSYDALTAFQLLHEQIGLPIAWNFQDWGSFTSGGIMLGNVVVELMQSTPSQSHAAYGIALVPNRR